MSQGIGPVRGPRDGALQLRANALHLELWPAHLEPHIEPPCGGLGEEECELLEEGLLGDGIAIEAHVAAVEFDHASAG
jgi:hypothetical protein